jgi:hypothetical protein
VCEKFLNDSHDLVGPQLSEKGFTLGRKNPSTDLVPIHVIRTETVLSKLPMHNLAKKGNVNIHIIKKNDQGHVELYWKVAPNPEYGDPRQLSYKLDTIVINQRIDQLERPLPKLIKLGSLREIAKELGRPCCGQGKTDTQLSNPSKFLIFIGTGIPEIRVLPSAVVEHLDVSDNIVARLSTRSVIMVRRPLTC